MIAILHDIVRAVLVLVVLAVGLEILQIHREAASPDRGKQQQCPTPLRGNQFMQCRRRSLNGRFDVSHRVL